ncbi:hypothetical protein EA472_09490 [Natrarchaeobius oligotrophus]|uniref:Uncharacterized protein n=1 Tax=Natrarchaeobius chitinivorans TaxID=1679083 RepID=A0A3N6MAM5_NATCH|nr:hypothetical protein EA472_09490 [Natrarchaeobius chitinivorans]
MFDAHALAVRDRSDLRRERSRRGYGRPRRPFGPHGNRSVHRSLADVAVRAAEIDDRNPPVTNRLTGVARWVVSRPDQIPSIQS